MGQPVSAERWAAIRALREGEPPTFPLLATATDLHPATLRERASRENWEKQDFQSSIARENWRDHAKPAAVETARLVVEADDGELHPVPLGDFVARQLAEMVSEVETNGGKLNKTQIDALWSMVRTAERSELLKKEPATESGATDDAELAARLEKLDDRIVELAEAHAERLVGQQHRTTVD
jgi:hypothetical protein